MKQISFALAALAFVGCGSSASEKPADAKVETGAPAKTEAPQPAAATAKPKDDAPAATRKPGEPLVFTPAADWVVEEPQSKMRVAQYKLAKVAGDAEDAELVVYHFGSMGGGSVDANLERWCSQFEQPDGRKSEDVLQRSERKVGSFDVTEVRLGGTYVAETSPGSRERVNKPGFAMLAAILKTDQGDYYAKLIGPANTVEHHAAAFRDFISRVK